MQQKKLTLRTYTKYEKQWAMHIKHILGIEKLRDLEHPVISEILSGFELGSPFESISTTQGKCICIISLICWWKFMILAIGLILATLELNLVKMMEITFL